MASFIKSKKQELRYFHLAYASFFILVSLVIPNSDEHYFELIQVELDWPIVLIVMLLVLYPQIYYVRYGEVHLAMRIFAALIAALPACFFMMMGVHEIAGRIPLSSYYLVLRFSWFLVFISCFLSAWFFFQAMKNPPPQNQLQKGERSED